MQTCAKNAVNIVKIGKMNTSIYLSWHCHQVSSNLKKGGDQNGLKMPAFLNRYMIRKGRYLNETLLPQLIKTKTACIKISQGGRYIYICIIYIYRCFKYCTSRESCFQNLQKEKYAEKIYNIVYCFCWLEPQISFGKQWNRPVWEEQHRISIDKCVWTGLCLLMITVRYLQNQWSQRSQIQYQFVEDLRWEWER